MMRVAKRVWYYAFTIMLALTLCTSALAFMTQGERTAYATEGTELTQITVTGVNANTVTQSVSNRWMVWLSRDKVLAGMSDQYAKSGANVQITYQEPGEEPVVLPAQYLNEGNEANGFNILLPYASMPKDVADGTKITFTFDKTFTFKGNDYEIVNDVFVAYKKGSTFYTEQNLTYAESYRHAGLQHFYFLADTSTAPFSATTDTNITSSIKLSVNGQAAFGPAEVHALANKSQIRIALTTSGLNTQLANAIPGMTIEKAETAKVDIVVGQTYTVGEINYYIASADSYVAVDASIDGVLKYEGINITEFVSATKDSESRWRVIFNVDKDITGSIGIIEAGNYGHGFMTRVNGKLPSELDVPLTAIGAIAGLFKTDDRQFTLVSQVDFLPSDPAEGTVFKIPAGAIGGSTANKLAFSFQNEMTLQYLSGEWKQAQTITETINNGTPEDRYVPVGTVFTAADIARAGYDITYAALNGVPMTPESEYTVTAFEDATIEVTYAPITYQAVFKADGVVVDTIDYTIETDLGNIVLPEIPIKAGYIGEWEDYEPALGGMTINVKWTAINYNIYYENMSDAINHVDNPASYTVESNIITLNAATKTGYIFDGWYTDDGVFTKEVTTILKGSIGDITLYAKWNIIVEVSSITAQPPEDTLLRNNTAAEEALALLPATATLTDTKGDVHIIDIIQWQSPGYNDVKTTGGAVVFTAIFTLPQDVVNDNNVQLTMELIVAPPADYTGLNAKVEQAEEYSQLGFTYESFYVLHLKLAAGRALIVAGDAFQAEADEAALQIQAAIDGLEEVLGGELSAVYNAVTDTLTVTAHSNALGGLYQFWVKGDIWFIASVYGNDAVFIIENAFADKEQVDVLVRIKAADDLYNLYKTFREEDYTTKIVSIISDGQSYNTGELIYLPQSGANLTAQFKGIDADSVSITNGVYLDGMFIMYDFESTGLKTLTVTIDGKKSI